MRITSMEGISLIMRRMADHNITVHYTLLFTMQALVKIIIHYHC